MASKSKIDPALLDEYFKPQRDALAAAVTEWIANTASLREPNRLSDDIAHEVAYELVKQHYKKGVLEISAQRDEVEYEISDGYIWIIAPITGEVRFLAMVMNASMPFTLVRDGTSVRFRGVTTERMEESINGAFATARKSLEEINKAISEMRAAATGSARDAVKRHVVLLKKGPEIEEQMKYLGIKKAAASSR